MDVVAELMIMANSAVAKRIYSAFPGQAILRCHRPPERERLSKLEAAAEVRTYALALAAIYAGHWRAASRLES